MDTKHHSLLILRMFFLAILFSFFSSCSTEDPPELNTTQDGINDADIEKADTAEQKPTVEEQEGSGQQIGGNGSTEDGEDTGDDEEEDDTPPPPVKIKLYDEAGPYSVTKVTSTGPDGAYTLYYPNSSVSTVTFPVLTWGNGTGAMTLYYEGLLRRLVSHGFIVIASNSSQTGSGQEMLNGITWVITENTTTGSVLFGKAAPTQIGALGHSQGGMGTINAGIDARVKCIAPIQPAPSTQTSQVKAPALIIAGSVDTITTPQVVKASYTALPASLPAVYAVQGGADHYTPVDIISPDLNTTYDMWYYLVAWFRANLMNDTQAKTLFHGDSCDLCRDPDWTIEKQNMQ